MWPFKKRQSSEAWHYLGYSEISWVSEGETTDTAVIHFYGRGADLSERKVECVKQRNFERHGWWQTVVVPWLNSGNLYDAISEPSEFFLDWTEQDSGYEWINRDWIKPAPVEKREGNIITLKVSSGDGIAS